MKRSSLAAPLVGGGEVGCWRRYRGGRRGGGLALALGGTASPQKTIWDFGPNLEACIIGAF